MFSWLTSFFYARIIARYSGSVKYISANIYLLQDTSYPGIYCIHDQAHKGGNQNKGL